MRNVNSLIEGWVKKKPAKPSPELEMTSKEFSQVLNSPNSNDLRVPEDLSGRTDKKVKKKSTKVKKKSTKVKKSPKSTKGRPAAQVMTSPISSGTSEDIEISEDQGVELSPDCDFGLPTVFKCGHTNYKHHGITEDSPLQVEARAEEYCCQALREATLDAWRLNPNMVNRKRRAHLGVNWKVRGLYEPVPEAMRRKPTKHNEGWPGLCCDPATGLYIGGLGNNCRYYHDGPERCVVHASKRVIDFSDEE